MRESRPRHGVVVVVVAGKDLGGMRLPPITPQVYLRTESPQPGYSVPIPGAFTTPK